MAAPASNLRDLHLLHQRAKALRDRLSTGPKTIATRQAVLATKQAGLDAARKALQDAKLKIKGREAQVQTLTAKIDDLKVKINTAKKNDEYRALTNQMAHDKAAIVKIEDEILESMGSVEAQAAEVAKIEAEVGSYATEIEASRAQFESQAGEQRASLANLDAAIVEAETIIPEDDRERYRRTVKQKGPDALAAVEGGACSSCWVSITPQALNELINKSGMIYCKTCGCILYLAEEDISNTRRVGSAR